MIGSEFVIAEEPVDAQAVGVLSLNYGQLSRYPMSVLSEFIARLNVDEFVETTSSWFDRWRLEIRRDDAQFGTEEGSPGAKFSSIGYPPLATMVREHAILLTDLLLEQQHEMLLQFPPPDAAGLRYGIVSLDGISIVRGAVVLQGLVVTLDGVDL